MKVVERRGALFSALHALRKRGPVALVPTMGNLHQGHASLVELAAREAPIVVVSIFVNPTQFGPGEDFETYPRTLEADLAMLATRTCHLVFAPDVAEMYPFGESGAVRVTVPGVTEGLCATSRPGHFDGVASAVTRLFALIRPDIAVFGEKDYQQLLMVRRLVTDLGFQITVIGAPIVREQDGLAVSSRNTYLSAEQRQHAPALFGALQRVAEDILGGETPQAALDAGLAGLRDTALEPEYLELRRASDLVPAGADDRELVVLGAARLGRTRLIDNLRITRPDR